MKGKRFKRATALFSTAAMLLTYADFSAIHFTVHAEDTPENVSYDVNGDGETAEGELAYKLDSADDLYWFADKINNDNENYGNINAFLACDITFNSGVLDKNGELNEGNFREWTPIGFYDENEELDIYYTGTFDGAENKISGLYFNNDSMPYVGLFGQIGNEGIIKNVTVADSYLNGDGCLGSICGYNEGTISNCYNTGAVTGYSCIGGICGMNSGTISNCYNTGEAEASVEVGGICGDNYGGTISNCYNAGDVTATDEWSYAGGVCGYNYEGTIENCSNTGVVTAKCQTEYSTAGGVCADNCGLISNCYNTGDVTTAAEGAISGGVCGRDDEGSTITYCSNTGVVTVTGEQTKAGGVCGYHSSGTITYCYNTGDVTASGNYSNGGGVCAINYDTIRNCYNTGAVKADYFFGGVCGENKDTTENCYFLQTAALQGINYGDGSAEAKSAEQFASGEVGWLLNGEQSDDPAFCQNLGTDAFPVLDKHHIVMKDGESYNNNAHSYKYGVCEHCGAFKDGIGARLAGVSLVLDGSIGVNFYMQLADEVLEDETAYMQFTLPNEGILTIKVSEAETKTIDGVTYYGFQCNVAATEMRDTIKAQIITANGNGTEYSYTVKEYADYLLAHTGDNDEYAKAEKLVKAMLTYGAYAQIFKGHNTDTLQSEQLSDVSDYVIDEHGYTAFQGNTVKFAGANLSMLSNTTLRLFFTADDMNGVTFMRGADQLEVSENNGLYFVEITNILPNKLNQDITVTVDDNGNEFFVTYSPMTYCYLVSQRSDDTALVNLVKAIAKYWYVAKECFEEAQ